jgi:hypothetical protein
MNFKAISLACVAGGLFAVAASAHHSFAMFDHNKTDSLVGVVKEVEWINPHVWVHLTQADAAGKSITWSFEAGSVGQLTQAGWKRDDLKVGDMVTMGYHPLKDGSHGGQVLTVKLPGGRELCQGRECEAGGGE